MRNLLYILAIIVLASCSNFEEVEPISNKEVIYITDTVYVLDTDNTVYVSEPVEDTVVVNETEPVKVADNRDTVIINWDIDSYHFPKRDYDVSFDEISLKYKGNMPDSLYYSDGSMWNELRYQESFEGSSKHWINSNSNIILSWYDHFCVGEYGNPWTMLRGVYGNIIVFYIAWDGADISTNEYILTF